jgi:hypothetical protein
LDFEKVITVMKCRRGKGVLQFNKIVSTGRSGPEKCPLADDGSWVEG